MATVPSSFLPVVGAGVAGVEAVPHPEAEVSVVLAVAASVEAAAAEAGNHNQLIRPRLIFHAKPHKQVRQAAKGCPSVNGHFERVGSWGSVSLRLRAQGHCFRAKAQKSTFTWESPP